MVLARLFAAAVLASSVVAGAYAAPSYQLVREVRLGTPDRWDYVVFDAASGRVYVAHSDRVTVIDGTTLIRNPNIDQQSASAFHSARDVC